MTMDYNPSAKMWLYSNKEYYINIMMISITLSLCNDTISKPNWDIEDAYSQQDLKQEGEK